MDFREMDPVIRALILGGLFLGTLAMALMMYYGLSERESDRREKAILWVLIVAAVATLPGLLVSAFALDVERQWIVNPAAYLSLGAIVVGVIATIAQRASSRRVAETSEYWGGVDEVDAPRAAYDPNAPTISSHSEPTIREGGSTTVARIDPADDRTQILRKSPPTFAYLAVRSGPRTGDIHALSEEMSIGRTGENAIALDDASVSRQHARVRLRDGIWTFADLDSTNGSFVVNGSERVRIAAPHHLEDGDRIEVGAFVLQFLRVGQIDK